MLLLEAAGRPAPEPVVFVRAMSAEGEGGQEGVARARPEVCEVCAGSQSRRGLGFGLLKDLLDLGGG